MDKIPLSQQFTEAKKQFTEVGDQLLGIKENPYQPTNADC
jgi:hypothetical protein